MFQHIKEKCILLGLKQATIWGNFFLSNKINLEGDNLAMAIAGCHILTCGFYYQGHLKAGHAPVVTSALQAKERRNSRQDPSQLS